MVSPQTLRCRRLRSCSVPAQNAQPSVAQSQMVQSQSISAGILYRCGTSKTGTMHSLKLLIEGPSVQVDRLPPATSWPGHPTSLPSSFEFWIVQLTLPGGTGHTLTGCSCHSSTQDVIYAVHPVLDELSHDDRTNRSDHDAAFPEQFLRLFVWLPAAPSTLPQCRLKRHLSQYCMLEALRRSSGTAVNGVLHSSISIRLAVLPWWISYVLLVECATQS